MHSKRLFYIIFFALSFAHINNQACAITYDLFMIYEQAASSDPIVLAAETQSFADQETLNQAEAVFLPTISAEASTTSNFDGRPEIGRYQKHGVTLSLNQSILNLTQASQWCEAKAAVTQSQITFESTKQSLIFRVSERYFAILAAQDDLRLARAQGAATEKFLDQTEQRYEAGLIAITDVYEARSRLDNANAQEITFKNEVNNQFEKLQEIVGFKISRIRGLRENLPLHKPEPLDPEYWAGLAVHQNLDLQAAKLGMVAAKQKILSLCRSHYPTLNLRANYGRNSNTPPFIDSPPFFNRQRRTTTGQIGLFLTVPIFSGGSVVSQTREARFQYETQDHRFMELYRQVISNTRQAYHNVLTQINQVNALAKTVFSTQSTLEATQAGFDAGTRTIVDVLNAQSDLTNAQRNYAKARYNYILALLQLKNISGELNPNDLYAINHLLSRQT